MKALLRFLLPVTLVVALAACGNDDDGNGDVSDVAPPSDDHGGAPPANDDSNGDDDGNGAVAPPSGSGSGTLALAGVTYEFAVEHCGFEPSETGNENLYFSLYGRGTSPDGERLEVHATTVEIDGDIESESVSLYIGEGFPAEISYESHRMQMNDMVTGTGEDSIVDMGLDWPLLQVDGKQVRAESGYVLGDFEGGDEEFVDVGVFEATCP